MGEKRDLRSGKRTATTPLSMLSEGVHLHQPTPPPRTSERHVVQCEPRWAPTDRQTTSLGNSRTVRARWGSGRAGRHSPSPAGSQARACWRAHRPHPTPVVPAYAYPPLNRPPTGRGDPLCAVGGRGVAVGAQSRCGQTVCGDHTRGPTSARPRLAAGGPPLPYGWVLLLSLRSAPSRHTHTLSPAVRRWPLQPLVRRRHRHRCRWCHPPSPPPSH